jgi:DNA primase
VTGDAVAEIKSRLDIVDVVGGYVSLQRAGREHKGLCPFHAEKSPSFHVSQERQAWYCFGCQEGGDVFDFVGRMERVEFRQALELLAERAGVELERSGPSQKGAGRRRQRTLELNLRAAQFYEHVLWNTPAGAAGRELLAGRDVLEALARHFGVGFAPRGGEHGDALSRYLIKHGADVKELVDAGLAHAGRGGPRDRFRHRLLFPIRDERGQVIGFGGRALGDDVPKYLNTAETAVYHKSTALFGLDLARTALREKRVAVVVEGYFDVMGSHAAGVENVVASSGTALTKEQVRMLKRHADSVVLCFDGDAAGEKAASRAVDTCAAEQLPARIVVLPEGVKDPDELVRRDPAGFAAAVAGAAPEWQVLLERAIGHPDTVEQRRAAAERAIALLARIPEASVRDLYEQEAARRLGLAASALAADVARALSGGRRGPVRLSAPVLPDPPVEERGLDDDGPGEDVSAWEEYIGAFAVQRPALSHILVQGLGLEPAALRSAAVRRLVEVALDVPPGLGFPTRNLGPGDKRLADRLQFLRIPELDDGGGESLEKAMGDCVARVGLARVRAGIDSERALLRRAHAAGREAEADEHLARLNDLNAEEGRLQRLVRR